MAAGFASYINDEGTFEPKPAGIVKRCKLLDGRPAAEEAWALSLLSTDENETIVWTQEMAEAFAIARPVLDSSGAISARKAFIEAYQRLIDVARFQMRAPAWIVSEGHDKSRKVLALQAAERTSRLPASVVAALLAPPEQKVQGDDPSVREQLGKVKKLLADLDAQRQANRAAIPTDAEIARQQRAELAKKVANYVASRSI
ncbi:hypothetical protein LT85_0984 [Collimonas arenae]|uniref:Uncharacterized protein n=1 Tax=Collimonas arenae TaxID=279058 RepID=A0A0A1FBC3_9BURK|nr:hypothetical protein LT85_0984 [Collimonas arenae]